MSAELPAHDTEARARAVLPVGSVVGERYISGRLLGSGAMGLVFEGVHRELEERVAIKMLLPDHLDNAELVARFAREARAAVRLKGEHVARVLDVGKHRGALPYIVMEYLEGEDLGALLSRRGSLTVEEACGYVIQACAGLAEAHARGIVHRDVKPENLFLAVGSDGRSRVKILDFGVSKVALTGTAVPLIDLAATSTMLGTPLYMSPEQIRSRDVDHRSDIWSLGVVLYELLTGRTPFSAANITELVSRVLEEPPAPVRQLRADLPEALERVVMRCLARDPRWRFDTVAALAASLLPFAPRASRAVAEQARAWLLHADEATTFPELASLVSAPAHDSLPPPAAPSVSSSLPATAAWVAPAAAPPFPIRTLWIIAAVLSVCLAVAVLALLRSPEQAQTRTRPTHAAPQLGASAAPPTEATLGSASASSWPAVSLEPPSSEAPSASAPFDREALRLAAQGKRNETPPARHVVAPPTPPSTVAPPRNPADGLRLTR